MKMQETLHNWGGITCEVVTDEDVKDINLAIKYCDHGDEFLYVRTNSGNEYEYGYYLDRKDCFADFDSNKNNGESDSMFIRRPILFKKPDERSILSNKIFWAIHDNYSGILNLMLDDIYKDISKANAEYRLKITLASIEGILNTYPDRMYHQNDAKDYLLRFIETHKLDEYISKVNEIKWDSKINGFDGIAGKIEASNCLYGDNVIEILYRGKEFDINKISYKRNNYDEWGFCTYKLNTKQFA